MPILGQLVYYSRVINGDKVYVTIPWAGNTPFDYTMISAAEYIAGLKTKVEEAKHYMATTFTKPGQVGSFDYATNMPHVGPTYNQTDIDNFLTLINQTENRATALVGQNDANLQVPELIEKDEDLRPKVTIALNEFLSRQRANTDIAGRLVTTYKDESGNLIQTKAQKFIKSFDKKGKPVYITIVPKFVVIDIYDKKSGRRGAKIGEALVGIVNSLQYSPSPDELKGLAEGVI